MTHAGLKGLCDGIGTINIKYGPMIKLEDMPLKPYVIVTSQNAPTGFTGFS